MPRASSSALYDEGNDTLRFEEAEDFGNYHNGHGATRPIAGHSTVDAADPADFGNLKRKQAELLQLRQELETKEREAEALEQRRQKEERFAKGRQEMSEQLSRTLVRLEREMYNAQKAIEEITMARDALERHLQVLRTQQPETWHRGDLDAELDLALAALDDAEDEFSRCSRRLESVTGHQASAPKSAGSALGNVLNLSADFRTLLKAGFAFTLPLGAILALTLLAIKILFR